MANWKTVKERWLPIVEKMEEHGMEDYAIPEIYRAAEREINRLGAALYDTEQFGLVKGNEMIDDIEFDDIFGVARVRNTKETNDG